MSKLLAKKRWWKICLPHTQNDATKNYREIIMHSECASVLAITDTSSSSSSASSGSPSDSISKNSQPDAGKLFPRNMPSIRRSRRRSAERRPEPAAAPAPAPAPAPAATLTVPAQQPQRSAHQSRQSTVAKLTPRKPKTNCSKQRALPSAGYPIKAAVKTKTKPKQLTLAPYDIALELPAPSCPLTEGTPSLARALHSQQSSLISSDLSGDNVPLKLQEEHFHSSGISCNGETDDDVEVAMLTGSLSPAQLQRLQQQQKRTMPTLSTPRHLPLNELRNLNVCRNRSTVWLHNADTEQLLGGGRGSGSGRGQSKTEAGCYLNAAIADDMQLSDIEEQLAKFDGQQQQQQDQQHGKAAKT
ncbi:uncharacterized protein LOC135429805 [Drosophila montana]|uniref:uncharacterized protein LOC135429805 n=1 Tax=Drosophila montana TaxID=40370 RepID=UPI00313AAF8E